jgi:hypothetical protein
MARSIRRPGPALSATRTTSATKGIDWHAFLTLETFDPLCDLCVLFGESSQITHLSALTRPDARRVVSIGSIVRTVRFASR